MKIRLITDPNNIPPGTLITADKHKNLYCYAWSELSHEQKKVIQKALDNCAKDYYQLLGRLPKRDLTSDLVKLDITPNEYEFAKKIYAIQSTLKG